MSDKYATNTRVKSWVTRTGTKQAELAAELGHSTPNTVSLALQHKLELTEGEAAKWIAAAKAVATRKAKAK